MNNDAAANGSPERWRDLPKEMQAEWDRLQRENAQLRAERDQVFRALAAILNPSIPINEEEILAQMGQAKPMRELLEELRTELVEE
jgi:hypothetical protein